jgi:hypothetical protein
MSPFFVGKLSASDCAACALAAVEIHWSWPNGNTLSKYGWNLIERLRTTRVHRQTAWTAKTRYLAGRLGWGTTLACQQDVLSPFVHGLTSLALYTDYSRNCTAGKRGTVLSAATYSSVVTFAIRSNLPGSRPCKYARASDIIWVGSSSRIGRIA